MTEPAPSPLSDPARYVGALVQRLVAECPDRRPTSPGERRAQELMQAEFDRLGLGLRTALEPFRFNASLYASLALHAAVATLATALFFHAPAAALGLHLLAGVSFLLDSRRRGYLLRRLFPFRPSQNLVATLPAQGPPRLRVVLAAHADAACTGLVFDPRVAPSLARAHLPLGLGRPLAVSTWSQFLLAGLDLVHLLHPLGPWAWGVAALVSVPTVGSLLFNLDIVLRDRVVPGACDDLSGVAALPVLAARLAPDQPRDVEYVFVVTGCEEASMGGAHALALSRSGTWDPASTVFVALDSLTNGDLRYFDQEGDVIPVPVRPELLEVLGETAAEFPQYAQSLRPFRSPVGGTDAHPFLELGYPACALVCIDDALGTPRRYHQPADSPENLELAPLAGHLDVCERLVRNLVRRRAG